MNNPIWPPFCAAAVLCSSVFLGSTSPVSAAPSLEFCTSRTPDQQLGATRRGPVSESPCTPLVENKKKPDRPDDAAHPPRDVSIENLQGEVATFLYKYNQFLACCKTDLNELHTIEQLGDEVGHLLAAAQAGLFSEHMKLRGWTLRELLPPVLKARADLATLRTKLEHIGAAREGLGTLDYEEAAREAARLHEVERALDQDIRPRSLPTGPKTGPSIGASSSVGGAIGKTPRTGTRIGAEGTVGTDFGVTPRTGRDLGVTGPTGFEIGGTGTVGPYIGDSRLNIDQSSVGSTLPQSTVGSSVSDTSVGSSLGPSTIGSSLGDTTIGSSLGGSSIGSNSQPRGSTR